MASDWDTQPYGGDPSHESSWNTDGAHHAPEPVWNAAEHQPTNSFDMDFQETGAAADEATNDGVCRRCQNPGHFARDCPEPRTDIACHNCGGPHMKKDCDQPQVKVCRLCKGEHDTIDCKTPYPIDMSDVPDLAEDQCWQMIKQSSDDSDIDDFNDAMKALQKACPEMTYAALEKQLRTRSIKFHLIALEKDVGEGYTNVNMQGEAGQNFAVAVFKSANCPRPNLLSKWPKDVDENISRLADAGITLTRGLDHCRRCDKYGHISKDCTEERVEVEGPKVICALCSEEGHRVRDCTQPRQKERGPITCKRCGNEGHIAKECDQAPVVTCRNCGEEGHMAKECEKTICRNCDQEGHISKDCTQPKDWSKVVCRHCGEKGHASATRCKPGSQVEKKDAEQANTTISDGDFMAPNGSSGGFDLGAGDWNVDAPVSVPGAW